VARRARTAAGLAAALVALTVVAVNALPPAAGAAAPLLRPSRTASSTAADKSSPAPAIVVVIAGTVRPVPHPTRPHPSSSAAFDRSPRDAFRAAPLAGHPTTLLIVLVVPARGPRAPPCGAEAADRFAVAGGDPVNGSDPSGLCSNWVCPWQLVPDAAKVTVDAAAGLVNGAALLADSIWNNSGYFTCEVLTLGVGTFYGCPQAQAAWAGSVPQLHLGLGIPFYCPGALGDLEAGAYALYTGAGYVGAGYALGGAGDALDGLGGDVGEWLNGLLDRMPAYRFDDTGSLGSGSGTGGPKSSPNFLPPTNAPQLPPALSELPPGYSIRTMGPTSDYPNGYWVETNAGGQPIDPSTGKPPSNVSRAMARAMTHVPLPPP
jgi:hypothetical protein